MDLVQKTGLKDLKVSKEKKGKMVSLVHLVQMDNLAKTVKMVQLVKKASQVYLALKVHLESEATTVRKVLRESRVLLALRESQDHLGHLDLQALLVKMAKITKT